MCRVTHVLLTGGVGSRLWPLSRKSRPKQYLPLFSDHSLFELAVKRNRSFAEKIIVVGSGANRHLSRESMEKLGVVDYIDIVETAPRNTAPAIAFAAFAAQPEDVLLVTPADHIIKEGKMYESAIQEAIELAEKSFLVTFGIKPTKPETGYGYIEANKQEVISFREKPDRETAESFLEKGNFLWNSGMFCFKAGVYLEELKKYQPEVYQQSRNAWTGNKNGCLNLDISLEIPAISVDYAVMEKSDRIKVVKSNFHWSDMGSFEAVYDYLKKEGHPVDDNGNMKIGTGIHTTFIGLENCILVTTPDAYLILNKKASQDVKKVYSRLEKVNPELIQ